MQQTNQDPMILQAMSLHTQVSRMIHLKPNDPIRMLLLFMSILSPVTAMLYLIAAIKRQSLLDRFWIIRMQGDGYLQPNMGLVIPIFVLLYTILSFAAMISLQRELQSGIISTQTIVLSMMSFPALYGVGWTRTWGVLNAIPPTKTGLSNWRNRINSPFQRLMTAKILNVMAILAYIAPFALSIIIAVPAAKHHIKLNTIWFQYEASYLNMVNGQASEEIRMNENLALLGQLATLLELSQSLLSVFKALSRGYFILTSSLLVGTLFAYFHILQALYSQLDILHKSVETRKTSLISFLDKDIGQISSSFSHSTNLTGTSSAFKKTGSQMLFPPPESPISSPTFQIRWMGWLPSFKRNTEIKSSVWETGLFTTGKETWEMAHVTLILEQYQVLKRFIVNTFWQAFLMCLVMVFYLGLFTLVFANFYDVPNTHSLVDLCLFIIVCSSMFWNLGIGTLEGTISCVVAFSPMPKPPREPETISC